MELIDGKIWTGETDHDGNPIIFRNHYHCPDCDIEWDDDYSCQVDDECPECGSDYSPYESTDLDEEGCEILGY